MANRNRAWIADIVQGIAACFLGGITLYILHDLWFTHWMFLLGGEHPASNPAYNDIQPIFMSLPYTISPLVTGLVAGFGKVRPLWKISIRLLAGPLLSLVFLTKESVEFTKGYLPIVLVSFGIAVIIAVIYDRLSRETKSFSPE